MNKVEGSDRLTAGPSDCGGDSSGNRCSVFAWNTRQAKLIELHYELVCGCLDVSVRRHIAKPQNSWPTTMHQLASEAEIFHSRPNCFNKCNRRWNAEGQRGQDIQDTHCRQLTNTITDMLNIAYILCIVSMCQIIMALICLCKYMTSPLFPAT